MKFEFALEKMKAGCKVRRESWDSGMTLFIGKKTGVLFLENPEANYCGGWYAHADDFSAFDWETVGEENKVTLEDFSTAELLSELLNRDEIFVNYDSFREESVVYGKFDGKIL